MLDLEASKTALNLTALLTTPEISQLNEAIKEKPPAVAGQQITILQLKFLNNSLFTKQLNIYIIPINMHSIPL